MGSVCAKIREGYAAWKTENNEISAFTDNDLVISETTVTRKNGVLYNAVHFPTATHIRGFVPLRFVEVIRNE